MRGYAGLLSLGLLGLFAAFTLLRPDSPAPTARPETERDISAGTRPGEMPTGTAPVPGGSQETAIAQGSGFDFYVLSLSWSPTFCQSADGADNPQQCGSSNRFGFIVHGLWPQNEKGYPQSCQTGQSDRVPEKLGRQLFDIMPGMGLIGHEWRKHGSCSGLDQSDYFSVLRMAYQRIAIPPKFSKRQPAQSLAPTQIERLFVTANPGLGTKGLAVTCEGDLLDEVRICLTKDLNFRNCPEVDRQSCRRARLSVEPMR
ncbi:MAG: ribonuclease T2 family protein [Allorhizobium sp.]